MNARSPVLDEAILSQILAAHCRPCDLPPVQPGVLSNYFEKVGFAPRQVIADIGEVGEALYIVVEGDAAIYQEASKEIEIARIEHGELMGEMSFFDRSPRSVRIRAGKQGAQVLRLTRPMYERLRVEVPQVAACLLEWTIVSLDHIFRRTSSHVAAVTQYVYGATSTHRR